jgi:AcrR family transcriptional regulator
MSALGESPVLPARRGYHHGHLREALIGATKTLLAEKGPQGFTLADAARLAGVSPAAPYRHFADRGALLLAVAREGFAAFAKRLEASGREAASPIDAFREMGRAYLAFAREEPGLYAAMFSARLPDAAPLAEGEAAFSVLVGAILNLLTRMGAVTGDPRDLALQIWSLSHGIATLSASGRLGDDCADAEDVLASGVEALVAASLARNAKIEPRGL